MRCTTSVGQDRSRRKASLSCVIRWIVKFVNAVPQLTKGTWRDR